jgi:flagellar biosynthesis/type III secretory pathway protein FliH
VLLTISKDEVERARLLSEYKYITDLQSHRVDAKREGVREGMEKGIKKGMEKGMEKGVKKGRNELLDLLRSGASREEIIRRYS